jgi:hypothetical protein
MMMAKVSHRGEKRSTQRHAVLTSAAVRGGAIRAVADVSNLSQGGLQLATGEALPLGSRLTLKLPLLEPIEASVVWANSSKAGCRFHEPLPLNLFDSACRALEDPTPVALSI